MGPIWVASRTPVHALAGCGSRQRRLPTGGCAKGMFLNAAPPFDVRVPRSWPVLMVTIGSEPAADVTACPKPTMQLRTQILAIAFMLVPSVLLFARIVRAVFRIARAVVLRMRGISTQGTAAPRKCPPRRHNRIGCLILLHPIHRRAQHVEAIERRAAAGAMAHAGRKKEAAPIPNLRRAPVGGCHALVVVDGVLGG